MTVSFVSLVSHVSPETGDTSETNETKETAIRLISSPFRGVGGCTFYYLLILVRRSATAASGVGLEARYLINCEPMIAPLL